MTPSERERRIEAGIYAWLPLGSPLPGRRLVAGILDAADEAVPMVSQRVKDEQQEVLDRQFWDMRTAWTEAVERAERAEAAARDFADAARRLIEVEQRWSRGAPGFAPPSPRAAFTALLERTREITETYEAL